MQSFVYCNKISLAQSDVIKQLQLLVVKSQLEQCGWICFLFILFNVLTGIFQTLIGSLVPRTT